VAGFGRGLFEDVEGAVGGVACEATCALLGVVVGVFGVVTVEVA